MNQPTAAGQPVVLADSYGRIGITTSAPRRGLIKVQYLGFESAVSVSVDNLQVIEIAEVEK